LRGRFGVPAFGVGEMKGGDMNRNTKVAILINLFMYFLFALVILGKEWPEIPIKVFIWFVFFSTSICLMLSGKEKANNQYPSYVKEETHKNGIPNEISLILDVIFIFGIMFVGWGWSFVVFCLAMIFKYTARDMQKKYAYEYLKEKEKNVKENTEGNGKGQRIDRRV
jgi:hypothetical protein